MRRGIARVTVGNGMVAMPSGPARAPLIAPSLLRIYGLRSAFIFVADDPRARRRHVHAARGGHRPGHRRPEGLRRRLRPGRSRPGSTRRAASRSRRTATSTSPTRTTTSSAASTPNNIKIEPVAGNHELGTGFSGDNGPAIAAQLDTPDGVAIAPDGDLIVADSHNDRIRRVDRPTGIITTIAGSGENGYDGDDKPAIEAALNTPSAVAAAPNGDIYIADTLNYRIRMIDAKTGLIHTVAGDGTPGDPQNVGDGGPATSAHLNMPSDVALAPKTGDLYIADMHHNRVRKVDAKTHIITTVAGSGVCGHTRRRRPGDRRRSSPARPASRVVARAGRQGRRSSSPTTTTATCARSAPTASSAT